MFLLTIETYLVSSKSKNWSIASRFGLLIVVIFNFETVIKFITPLALSVL